MSKLFHKFNSHCNGWPETIVIVLLEIFVIYFLSNIPFILATLETPVAPDGSIGFWGDYIKVLQSEISKGQLLIFVCTLIAPVVFWSFIEFKKAFMTKLLSFSALFLLAVAAYLHGKGSDFEYFTSFNLYQAALFIWIVSILSNRIPPDRNAALKFAKKELESFIDETREL